MTATDLVITNDATELERLTPDAREASVTLYLLEARDKLSRVVEMTGPASVAALKAEIATAAEATRQLGLSKEIQSDAREMCRRAEYALGKAIRMGQAAGEIRKPGDDSRTDLPDRDAVSTLVSPREFVPDSHERNEIYAMVDNADAEEFDRALDQAKAEGNLSRANVVRKVKGDAAPKGDRPEVLHRTRRLDSNRIVAATVEGAVVPTSTLDLVDYSALDRSQLGEWIDSLSESIKALSALRKRLAAEHEKEPIQ